MTPNGIKSLKRRHKLLQRSYRELRNRLRKYECPRGHVRFGYGGRHCPVCARERHELVRAEQLRGRERLARLAQEDAA